MKRYTDIQVGDKVICFDEYSHDYIEHLLLVESCEQDKEYITDTNPEGLVFYGKDLTYPEDETDDYITLVTEANYCRIQE